MNKNACIVFDPIPFEGGSKVATRHMLEVSGETRFHILTSDTKSWNKWLDRAPTKRSVVLIHSLLCPQFLIKQSSGWGYWVKQIVLMLNIVGLWLKLSSRSQFNSTSKRIVSLNTLLLISGPGVDLAGYLFSALTRKILSIKIIQCIHGPVFGSRVVSWCLKQGHQTFYLPSSKSSINTLLSKQKDKDLPEYFVPFTNGIPESHWPSVRNSDSNNFSTLKLFWAASLLKWKGLDLLIQAHHLTSKQTLLSTSVCYIKPQNSYVEQSEAPQLVRDIKWFEEPENLDEIRANCDVFVSTSHSEPFGLSVLESMAAGLLVVIPRDGAYWDKTLTDHQNCVKYVPNDVESLAKALVEIAQHRDQYQSIARHGYKLAKTYTAKRCYQQIKLALEGSEESTESESETKAIGTETSDERGAA
ncbi:glycosyltransferase family 4 protein [Vibrio maerlii]|uniref:glycosyltransferase family 4 protein n=1 Tax=Vibrio maerlii TaxID=2231648 RepID=UPI000E3BCCA1|nr:glycosyltransferase family 4 protein [Vibrio maerlii]